MSKAQHRSPLKAVNKSFTKIKPKPLSKSSINIQSNKEKFKDALFLPSTSISKPKPKPITRSLNNACLVNNNGILGLSKEPVNSLSKSTSKGKNKPTYAFMIANAILSSENKNSVRHNLSLNKAFINVRELDDSNKNNKKGGYWTFNDIDYCITAFSTKKVRKSIGLSYQTIKEETFEDIINNNLDQKVKDFDEIVSTTTAGSVLESKMEESSDLSDIEDDLAVENSNREDGPEVKQESVLLSAIEFPSYFVDLDSAEFNYNYSEGINPQLIHSSNFGFMERDIRKPILTRAKSVNSIMNHNYTTDSSELVTPGSPCDIDYLFCNKELDFYENNRYFFNENICHYSEIGKNDFNILDYLDTDSMEKNHIISS